MAGYVIYSFDWDLFEDLTTNPKSTLPTKIAEKVVAAEGKKLEGSLACLPASKDETAKKIGALFLNPEWFADQSEEDVQLRQELLMKLLFSDKLSSIGLSAEPPEQECIAFELPHLLSGLADLDMPRVKSSGEAYYKYRNNPPKTPSVFSLFGSRPYRHGKWKGSNEELMEFEGTFERPAYSIHSKTEVQEMLAICQASSRRYADVPSEQFAEMLNDLHNCLEAAAERDAGIFVDNDY